jgi:hypothetical protein
VESAALDGSGERFFAQRPYQSEFGSQSSPFRPDWEQGCPGGSLPGPTQNRKGFTVATVRPEGSEAAPAAPQQQQVQPQVQIDDSRVQSIYTNFCRVTGTPEELIIDFGLNSQPVGVPTEPIAVTQRVITNYYTAKRLLHVLEMTLQRHEGTFGALEIDVQRRVRRT